MGECAPLPDLSCDARPEYEATLEQLCRMTELTGTLNHNMLRPYPSILFGLETALLDLENGGKGILYDTPFTRGEEGICINGLVWMGNYDEMLQRIEDKMKAGFRCVKLKIGAIDFDRELDLVHHIREAFDEKQIELRLDANGGFAPDVAMTRLEQLALYRATYKATSMGKDGRTLRIDTYTYCIGRGAYWREHDINETGLVGPYTASIHHT